MGKNIAAFGKSGRARPKVWRLKPNGSGPYLFSFERQDENAIKQLMTSDHIAVTPYYDEPQSVAQLLASLKQLKIVQTKVSQTVITLLGPDVALRTSIANFEGTFTGKPLPSRMFVTEVVVKRDGRWLERLYQATTLEP